MHASVGGNHWWSVYLYKQLKQTMHEYKAKQPLQSSLILPKNTSHSMSSVAMDFHDSTEFPMYHECPVMIEKMMFGSSCVDKSPTGWARCPSKKYDCCVFLVNYSHTLQQRCKNIYHVKGCWSRWGCHQLANVPKSSDDGDDMWWENQTSVDLNDMFFASSEVEWLGINRHPGLRCVKNSSNMPNKKHEFYITHS